MDEAEKKIFECVKCFKTYASKRSLNRHISQKMDELDEQHIMETLFKCALCHEDFKNKRDFEEHLNKCKSEKIQVRKIYKCDECGEDSKCRRTYEMHKHMHEKNKILLRVFRRRHPKIKRKQGKGSDLLFNTI